jgi:hypothetical protein
VRSRWLSMAPQSATQNAVACPRDGSTILRPSSSIGRGDSAKNDPPWHSCRRAEPRRQTDQFRATAACASSLDHRLQLLARPLGCGYPFHRGALSQRPAPRRTSFDRQSGEAAPPPFFPATLGLHRAVGRTQLVEGCQDTAEALFDGLPVIPVSEDIKLLILHRPQYPVCDGSRLHSAANQFGDR